MPRPTSLAATALIVVAVLCVVPSSAVVTYYKGSSQIKLPAGMTQLFRLARYGYYSTLTAPNWGSCHLCPAEARVNLTLYREDTTNTEVVYIMLHPTPSRENEQFSCDADNAISFPGPHGQSLKLGRSPAGVLMEYIFSPGQNESRQFVDAPNANSYKTLELLASARDGIYYLQMFSCAQQNISASGHIALENPYGHVSADLFPLIPWYMTMALCFGFVSSLWTVINALRHEHILPLQWAISGVLVLCLLESAGWFVTYQEWNDSGSLSNGLVMLCILFSASKWSIARGLILAVSMGWSIVRSSLGTDVYKIGIATLAYFVFSSAYKTSSLDENLEPQAQPPSILVVLGMAVVDALFYWWTVMSLLRTISALTVRKQMHKVGLYTKLFYILVISLLMSAVIVGGYLVATSIANDLDQLWRVWWFFDTASYSMVYMFVLVSLAIIFRPSPDNTVFIATPESEGGIEMRAGGADDAAATPELLLSPMGITLDEEDLEDRAGKTE